MYYEHIRKLISLNDTYMSTLYSNKNSKKNRKLLWLESLKLKFFNKVIYTL